MSKEPTITAMQKKREPVERPLLPGMYSIETVDLVTK